MIKSSANITTGSQTQGDVRSKLSIATPIFMRTFHILFDSRPKIIGKLRSFYHNMNLGIKATHSISCTYNIIFSYRGTEHTCFPKFLLHTFRYIKHTAFFLIGNILPPDKRIGIMTKFRFQCFVNRIDQESLFPFRIMSSILIFLRLVRFRHYKIINTLRIRIGSSQSFPVGNRQLFFSISFYLLQSFFSQTLVAQQHSSKFHQRVGILHIFQFVLIPV